MHMHSTLTHRSLRKIRSALADWFGRNRRMLPWRESPSPYRVWVSEVMLQQTQVITVIPYYQRFLSTFGDIHRLAGAHLDDVLKLWEGLGYYARARHLHRAAGIVSTTMGGRIPDQYNEFRALPGVGAYIAAAVLSIAFNQPYAVVDGNVKRVLARLYKIGAPVNHSSSYSVFKDAAGQLLDSKQPGTFNQAMMELGALICKPQNPLCDACPLDHLCLAFKTRRVAEFPKRQKSKATPQYHIAVGVVFKGDRVLITRRKAEGLLGGLWEFPGGKIKKGETAEAACIREIREEVNLELSSQKYLVALVSELHGHVGVAAIIEAVGKGPIDSESSISGNEEWTEERLQWISVDELDEFNSDISLEGLVFLKNERLLLKSE